MCSIDNYNYNAAYLQVKDWDQYIPLIEWSQYPVGPVHTHTHTHTHTHLSFVP